MNNPTIVPVFFSCDDNYLPFLSVALRSMIDNLGDGTVCRVHVLNDGLCEEGKARLLAMQTDRVTLEFVDVRPQIAPILDDLKLRDYYADLERMCEDLDVSRTEIEEKLDKINYHYDAERNQFV